MSRDRLYVELLSPPLVPFIVDYLTQLSDADIERMGMLRERLPSPRRLAEALHESIEQPVERRHAAYLLWMRGSEPIGYSALKRIQFGLYGDMHLHIVDRHNRGHGDGATLFCQSALHFQQNYELRLCLCEPRASNEGPNRMLQKIGFPLLKTFCGCSSELTYPTEISQYLITRAVAQRYLNRHPATLPA